MSASRAANKTFGVPSKAGLSLSQRGSYLLEAVHSFFACSS